MMKKSKQKTLLPAKPSEGAFDLLDDDAAAGQTLQLDIRAGAYALPAIAAAGVRFARNHRIT